MDFSISNFGMYIPNFGMYIPNFGMYVSNFATENFPLQNYFFPYGYPNFVRQKEIISLFLLISHTKFIFLHYH